MSTLVEIREEFSKTSEEERSAAEGSEFETSSQIDIADPFTGTSQQTSTNWQRTDGIGSVAASTVGASAIGVGHERLLRCRSPNRSRPRSADAHSPSSASLSTDNTIAASSTTLEELVHILRLALPLAATNLCAFAIGLVSFAFVGRLGHQQLAVVILSTSLFNVTGLSIIQGFNSTLETFCGQAWGAENYAAVGIALQRVLLLDSIASGIIVLLWYGSTAPLLRMLGQDPQLSSQASDYLLVLAPALWFASIYEALKRFLAVQGKGTAGAVVTCTGLALCPIYNYLLIYTMNLGLHGAALAVVAVEITLAIGLIGYSINLERKRAHEGSLQRTWKGWWTWESFSGWGLFLRHAGPSIVMIAAEWWTFELLVILSGWLEDPETQLAIMGICLNVSATVWSTISGLSLACSARVAATLGAGMPHVARQTALLSFEIGVIFEIIVAGFIFEARNYVGYGFTSSEKLAQALGKLMPVFVLSLPGDGANCVLQGLLRGTGKQSVGAVTNMCFYWLIGLPLAYYLGFLRGFGLYGLWAAVAFLNTSLGVVMLGISFFFIDFEEESRKAISRSGTDIVLPLLLNTEESAELNS